jgi:hypothetical protein
MARIELGDGHEFLSIEDGESPRDSWTFELADDGRAARVLQDGVYWTRIN